MKALKIIGAVLGGLLVVLFGVGLALPTHYALSRTTSIRAEPAAVFAKLNDLKEHPRWSPWKPMDPTLKITISEPSTGPGAWYEWQGEHSGAGRLTIIDSDPNNSVQTRLDFDQKGSALGWMQIDPTSEGVDVTWGVKFDAETVSERYFGLFLEPMLGPQFEDGLARLKSLCEADAA